VAILVALRGVVANGDTLENDYPTGAVPPSTVCCAAAA